MGRITYPLLNYNGAISSHPLLACDYFEIKINSIYLRALEYNTVSNWCTVKLSTQTNNLNGQELKATSSSRSLPASRPGSVLNSV